MAQNNQAGPSTAGLLAAARRVMAPCYAPPDLIAKRGKGALLWDHDDRCYLDFTSGIGVSALGHAHPEVVAAISDQAEKLLHTANIFYHQGHIEMCQRLVDISAGQRVFLSNSGTEAMEAAIKAARRYFHTRGQARTGLVATHGSFHRRSASIRRRSSGPLGEIAGFTNRTPAVGALVLPVTAVPAIERDRQRVLVVAFAEAAECRALVI